MHLVSRRLSKLALVLMLSPPVAGQLSIERMPALQRDPFTSPAMVSCQSMAAGYIAHITQWRWLGIVQHEVTADSVSSRAWSSLVRSQIWLQNHDQVWIALTFENEPVNHADWQLSDIVGSQLIWLKAMPAPCLTPLIYTMNLQGH